MSVHLLKPRFQKLLRPITSGLARRGVSANQVTLLATFGSLSVGGIILASAQTGSVFLLLPLWFSIRMALNAIDGMLARDFNQKTSLGAYLNELSDVISDAALYLPFALIMPFDAFWVATVIFLSTVCELAGILGAANGASRRYDGPMGKSDRALVFSGLGLVVGLAIPLPHWTAWIMPGLAVLLCLTILNRVRCGLREVNRHQFQRHL